MDPLAIADSSTAAHGRAGRHVLGVVAACVVALWGWGVAAIRADAPEAIEVGVRLYVDSSVASIVAVSGLEEEAASLWRPYGVQLEWIDARHGVPAQAGYSLDVFVEPQIDAPPVPSWTTVMGRAFVGLDAPTSHPIRISVDATERVLALRRARASLVRSVHERELARALGRVLAHEIGHVLLAAPYHASAGLMRPVFLPSELAMPDRAPFALTCDDISRLHARSRLLTGGSFSARHELEAGAGLAAGPDGIDRANPDTTCIIGHAVR